MNLELLKSYLRYSYKGILIGLFVLVVINYFSHDGSTFLINLAYLALGVVREYFHYGARLEKIAKLKARGLTEEDVINIEFVKKWEETRQGEIWKYCINDGGIIAGAGLSLLTSILAFMIIPNAFHNMFSGPEKMFQFIGYNYMAGAAIGVIVYRIRWNFNERRFIRLTDPLNINFMSRETSFKVE